MSPETISDNEMAKIMKIVMNMPKERKLEILTVGGVKSFLLTSRMFRIWNAEKVNFKLRVTGSVFRVKKSKSSAVNA